ncbi:MAG: glycosyltransferase, partial [Candidatus Thiodiazotropha sp.]
MVTTSFPVGPNRASGIFVKRLADSICDRVDLRILTPSSLSPCPDYAGYQVFCFRYAPYKWQILAHEPGGVLVALKVRPWLVAILPVFILSLFLSVIRSGREADIIHANWSITGVIAGLAGLCIGKPVITTLRGSDVSSIERSRISRLIVVQALRLSKRVVTVSDAITGSLAA